MTPAPSLAHDASEDAIGEAVRLCQGYTPDCFRLAECQMDGACFRKAPRDFAKAVETLDATISAEKDAGAALWLRLALNLLKCCNPEGAS